MTGVIRIDTAMTEPTHAPENGGTMCFPDENILATHAVSGQIGIAS